MIRPGWSPRDRSGSPEGSLAFDAGGFQPQQRGAAVGCDRVVEAGPSRNTVPQGQDRPGLGAQDAPNDDDCAIAIIWLSARAALAGLGSQVANGVGYRKAEICVAIPRQKALLCFL